MITTKTEEPDDQSPPEERSIFVVLEDSHHETKVYASREGICELYLIASYPGVQVGKVVTTKEFDEGDFIIHSNLWCGSGRHLTVLFGSVSREQAVRFGCDGYPDNRRDWFMEGDVIHFSREREIVRIEGAVEPALIEGADSQITDKEIDRLIEVLSDKLFEFGKPPEEEGFDEDKAIRLREEERYVAARILGDRPEVRERAVGALLRVILPEIDRADMPARESLCRLVPESVPMDELVAGVRKQAPLAMLSMEWAWNYFYRVDVEEIVSGGEDAIPELVAISKDEDAVTEKRMAALVALERLDYPDEQFGPLLFQVTVDCTRDYWHFRPLWTMLERLAKRDEAYGLSAFLSFFGEQDQLNQHQAHFLKEFGEPAIPILERLLDDPDSAEIGTEYLFEIGQKGIDVLFERLEELYDVDQPDRTLIEPILERMKFQSSWGRPEIKASDQFPFFLFTQRVWRLPGASQFEKEQLQNAALELVKNVRWRGESIVSQLVYILKDDWEGVEEAAEALLFAEPGGLDAFCELIEDSITDPNTPKISGDLLLRVLLWHGEEEHLPALERFSGLPEWESDYFEAREAIERRRLSRAAEEKSNPFHEESERILNRFREELIRQENWLPEAWLLDEG